MPRVRRPAAGLTRRHARAVWSGAAGLLALSVTLAVAVASALPATPAGRQPAAAQPLVAASVLVAFELAMAYVVPRRTRQRAGGRLRPDTLAAVQTIAASTLALGAGLVCCAFFLVTREPLLLPLVVPCAAVLLHWRPSEARWVALGGSGTERPHRMMRG